MRFANKYLLLLLFSMIHFKPLMAQSDQMESAMSLSLESGMFESVTAYYIQISEHFSGV